MFVLSVVFPVKKGKKKSTEFSIHGKLHPFSREAKWSLLELISPHVFIFSSVIMAQQLPFHWNGSALPLEIKKLLDNHSKCFLHVVLRRGILLFIKQQAEANQKGFCWAAWSKRLKEIYWLVRCVNQGKLSIYFFGLTNTIRMSPQWSTLTEIGILSSAGTWRPCLWHLATLILSLHVRSAFVKSEQPS